MLGSGTGEKKIVLGVSWTGGERWRVEWMSRGRNHWGGDGNQRAQESREECWLVAGGGAGAGEDLGKSREEIAEGRKGKTKIICRQK